MVGLSLPISGLEAAVFLVVQAGMLIATFACAEKKNSRILLIIAILISGIAVGMRFNIGIDTPKYAEWVITLGNRSSFQEALQWTDHERSFVFLSYFTYKITGSYRLLFLVYAIATAGFFLTGLWNFRKEVDIVPSLLYYIVFLQWNSMCNIMRQSLAMAIIFWGFQFIRDRKTIKYILSVLLATVFHTSAIVSIVLLFWGENNSKIGIAMRKCKLFIALGLLFLPRVIITIMTLISNRYNYLIKTKTGFGFIVNVVIIIALYYYVQKNKKRNDRTQYLIFQITVLASIFVISDYTIGEAARFREYFNTIYILALGYMSPKQTVTRTFKDKSISIYSVISYGYPLLYFALLINDYAINGMAFSISLLN